MTRHAPDHPWAGICLAPGCNFGHDVLDVEERERIAREWLPRQAADAAVLAVLDGLAFSHPDHTPLADGSCLHRWRNRTDHFVRPCPFVEGWLHARRALITEAQEAARHE